MNNEFNNWFDEEKRLFDKWLNTFTADKLITLLDDKSKKEFEQFKQDNSIEEEEKKEAFLDFIDKGPADDKIRDRIKLTLDGELKNEFEQFKQHNSINDEEKKEAFLDFIDKWYADDKLRREIMKDIYQETNMYQFLRKVKADYKEKYQLTKISIGKLEPLKEKCLEEEKEKSITVNGAVKLELKDVENENSQKKYVLDT